MRPRARGRLVEGVTAQTVDMLKAVVDGQTFVLVAADFGVTRTAVERRVKALAARICRQVGIEGLSEGATSFVSRLRKKRNEILVALDRFDPTCHEGRQVHRRLSDEETAQAALRIRARSVNSRRDTALFWMLLTTGAWPLEIARLEVRDYLNADGGVRRESELRAEVAITGKARALQLTSAGLDESMAEYLRQRVELRHGHGQTADYRGLDPLSRLFLTQAGEGFKITPYGEPGQRRHMCRPILETYRKLFRYAELKGVTALSVRRTIATQPRGRA